MRTRLTSEQREQRRRARAAFSFSDQAYEHYNPRVEGFGSWEQWQEVADEQAEGRGGLKQPRSRTAVRDKNLELLGLTEMPASVQELKSAFRKAAFASHPDHGGSEAAFIAVFKAYEKLVEAY